MKGYYQDNVTKFTDAFYVVRCSDCGHAPWSVLKVDHCSKCKSKNVTCVSANEDKK